MISQTTKPKFPRSRPRQELECSLLRGRSQGSEVRQGRKGSQTRYMKDQISMMGSDLLGAAEKLR